MGTYLLLLTGERGVGKTTVCQRTVALASAAGWSCGGLLTLRLAGGDEREVVDVCTGERRLLTTTGNGVRQGDYIFDPETLAWGEDVLARALPCDLLVVDELGPLELERGQGWAGAIDALSHGQFRLALVVVRPELLSRAQRQLRHATVVVTVTPQNRDRLPSLVLQMAEKEI